MHSNPEESMQLHYNGKCMMENLIKNKILSLSASETVIVYCML